MTTKIIVKYLTVVALATICVGCSSPEVKVDRPAKNILSEIVDNLEAVLQNAGKQQVTEVAVELHESSVITADFFKAAEKDAAVKLASQIEEFAKAVPAERKQDLEQRIQAMRATVSQLP